MQYFIVEIEELNLPKRVHRDVHSDNYHAYHDIFSHDKVNHKLKKQF